MLDIRGGSWALIATPEVAAHRSSCTCRPCRSSRAFVPSSSHVGLLTAGNFEVALLVFPLADLDYLHFWRLGDASFVFPQF